MGEALTMGRLAKRRWAPWLFALLALPSLGFAHRLDEYLQATLVVIEPGELRLEINLTPGVSVAEEVLSLIDRDRDGLISMNEAAAYAQLLKRDLLVRLDQHPLDLKLIASNFPEPSEIRSGSGIIQMDFALTPNAFTSGVHSLSFENRHLPKASVYLFNAAQSKSPAIRILRQKRNENQSADEIDFTLQSPPTPSRSAWVVAVLATLIFARLVVVLRARSSVGKGSGAH